MAKSILKSEGVVAHNLRAWQKANDLYIIKRGPY